MAQEKVDLLTLLNKTSKIETLLTTASGTGIPWQKTVLRTINDKPEFVLWKAQLKYQLQAAPQDQLIQDTIAILDNGFKNGFTDESDFRELKAKLNLIAEHVGRYGAELSDIRPMEKKQSMKKGATVKTAFDEYTLIKQVGSGGNGRVFSASNTSGEKVAIKFVERSISKEKLKRFKNEIYFCEQHPHKSIVRILDRGYALLDETDYVFYIMPLYSETLRKRMKRGIAPEEATTIFVGIIKGLKYAHSLGAIHRDIKPENIMFDGDSNDPILCDFGIAHFAEEDLITAVETQLKERMANFQYAAPEQRAKGKTVTAQADIYSAALVLNEMFTGEIPQAADYKTIGSIAPEYRFLDDVFVLLYKQNPNDRLFPEDKILTELKVRAERAKNEQEIIRLRAVVIDEAAPEEFEASVINKEYKDDSLFFILDHEVPHEWFQILSNGRFGNHNEVVGYGPERLSLDGKSILCMAMHRGANVDTITLTVRNVIDWVKKTNIAYSSYIKQVAQEKQRQKEEQRKTEIERLERENNIQEILAQLEEI